MRFKMSGCLWMQQLSITITEFGAGNGCIWSRVHSMNLWNFSVSKEPSMMSQWRTPSSRDSAGSTEYLEHENSFSLCYAHLWYWSAYLCPQQKGFSCGLRAMYSPCPTSVCCTTINSAFINKNELVRLICSNPGCKHRSLLNASFKCHTRELKHTVSDILSPIGLTSCLFHAVSAFH